MNTLKSKLRRKELTIGSWITLAHPGVAEIMARAGFDWLVVDLEHSAITIGQAADLIRIIDLCGSVPLVRLSCNDAVQIKRVMDAGAHGIIVPMVNTVEEAENAVSAVCYPPEGKRGVGLARAQGYGNWFHEYKEWVNRESVIVVQVEHVDSVRNLKDILAVERIDGFIVGPYDLSGSLGIPGEFENELMIGAMSEIKKSMQNSPKVSGYHVVEPEIAQLMERVKEGYRFLAYSVDFRMLDSCCRLALKDLRSNI